MSDLLPPSKRPPSPSDYLVKAMEHAEEMDEVVVVWKTKVGQAGMISSASMAEAFVLMDYIRVNTMIGKCKNLSEDVKDEN